MKKLICLTLSLLMLLCAVSAHAELFLVDGTPVSFDPCGAELFTPDEAAQQEGAVVFLAYADEALKGGVYVSFGEGLTTDLIYQKHVESKGEQDWLIWGTATGDVSQLELFFVLQFAEGGDTSMSYYYLDEEQDMCVLFRFWGDDSLDTSLIDPIIDSITIAE